MIISLIRECTSVLTRRTECALPPIDQRISVDENIRCKLWP